MAKHFTTLISNKYIHRHDSHDPNGSALYVIQLGVGAIVVGGVFSKSDGLFIPLCGRLWQLAAARSVSVRSPQSLYMYFLSEQNPSS